MPSAVSSEIDIVILTQQSTHKNNGFTLIEVLVALVILSVGLLGLAGLQTSAMRAGSGAYLRTQANNLAYNLIDRMRANPVVASSYDIALTNVVAAPTTQCNTSSCDASSLAKWDMSQWMTKIDGLPSAKASVAVNNAGSITIVTVHIEWLTKRVKAKAGADSEQNSVEVTTVL